MAEDNNEVPAQDKAPVDNTEQEKKEVAEMPPAYDETNPLTSEEPSVKITVSSDTKIDMGKEKEAFQGLSKEELMKYANDPFWVRLRWILFILFWFIWIAMLVASIVIIIYAPKCPSPEPKQWWQKNVMYKVSQDSGFESLNALKDNLDDLVETGVGTIFIPDLLESGTINTDWGTLEDFGDLVTALQQRDQKVVVGSLRPGDDARTWIESGVNGLVVDAGFTDDDLMKLRAVVDDMTENQGKSCIIISSDDLGENVHLTLSTNNNLAPSTAADLKTGLDMYMGQLSDEAWPSLGWVDKSWAKSLTDASMILKLLMPGTPVIEAGQELGGLNAWSKTTFDDQKNEPGSHWNVFSTLAHKMRHQDSILFGEFNSKTTFVDGDVFGMTRVKKGNPGYLLLVNFGAEPAVVNVANVAFVPDGIRLMTKSFSDAADDEATRFESKEVSIGKEEAKVFTFVPKYK